MDIFAHSLWTGLIFRKQKKIYWPIFFGVAPDLFSFGVYLMTQIFYSSGSVLTTSQEHLNPQVPDYLNILYNITHSFVFFIVVFLIVWYWRKKPWWPILAWGIHIGIDIPLHSGDFFPTPFLFPVSGFKLNSISWGNSYILLGNYIVLAALYFWTFVLGNKRKKLVTYLFEKRKLAKK